MAKKGLVLLLIVACLLLVTTQAVSASKYLETQIESDSVQFVVVDRDVIAHTIEVTLKDAAKVAAKLKGDKRTFEGIATGVNSEYEIEDGSIKEEIILLSDKAKQSFDFEIVKATRLTVEQYGNTLRFLSAEGDYPVITCPEPYATDALGRIYRYEYKLTGKKIKLQPVDSLVGAVYPVVIDPSYLVSSDGIFGSTYADRTMVRDIYGEFYLASVLNTGGNDTIIVSHSEDLSAWSAFKTFTGLYGNASHASIAADSEGGLHVVWVNQYNATRDDVYYSYYNGSAWTDSLRITNNFGTVFNARYAAVAIDENDYAHIVWYFEDYYITFHDSGVYHQKCFEGALLSSNLVYSVIYSTADIELGTCSIAVDENNVLYVAYSLRDPGETNSQIMYSYSINGGDNWASSDMLTEVPDGSQTEPAIAVDNHNDPVIVYGSYSSGNWTSRKIRLVYYNGSDWESPKNVSTTVYGGAWTCNGYWQGKPSISFTTQYYGANPTEFWVTWWGYDSVKTTDAQTYYRLIPSGCVDDEDLCAPTSIYIFNRMAGSGTRYPINLWATWPHKCNSPVDIPKSAFCGSYIQSNDSVYVYSYYQYPVGLSWPEFSGYSLSITALDIETGNSIMNFTASLDTGSSDTTTDGSIFFDCEDADTWIAISIQSTGYYLATENVYLDSDKEIMVRMTAIQEDVYVEPRIHLVEWRVQNRYAQPIPGVLISAAPVNTSGFWSWLRSIFLLDEGAAEEIQNSTLNATTDSNGIVVFTMLETIEYELHLYNATLGIDETYYFFPKQDSYVITVGEIPSKKIAYYITTEQNNTANTGNITCHFLDYASPVETDWVNFSVFYANNDTLVYSYNFTSPSNLNEDTSDDLNASYTYKVVLTASHSELGLITTYTIIAFVVPEHEKIPFGGLSDTQLTVFSCFILIFMAMIFGAVASGTGGIILSFTALGLYAWGWLPLISKATAAIIFPLFILLSVVNKLSERPRGYPT